MELPNCKLIFRLNNKRRTVQIFSRWNTICNNHISSMGDNDRFKFLQFCQIDSNRNLIESIQKSSNIHTLYDNISESNSSNESNIEYRMISVYRGQNRQDPEQYYDEVSFSVYNSDDGLTKWTIEELNDIINAFIESKGDLAPHIHGYIRIEQ